MSETKKKKPTIETEDLLSFEESKPSDPMPETDTHKHNQNDFETHSPLLNEEVIERSNELVLDAQIPEDFTKAPEPMPTFGMPKLTEAVPLPTEEVLKEPEKTIPDFNTQPVKESLLEEKPEENLFEELPKMKVEQMDSDNPPQNLNDIKKKAGQTTAKWGWTLFENAGPKLQLFLSELSESQIQKLVLDDLLPPEAIDFARDYNKSLEDEFQIKEWEKELILPPFEELLEQAGMNASMSPGAKLGIGLTVVMGARFVQTRKYRAERDELVDRLIKSYSKSKGENLPGNPTGIVKEPEAE